MKEQISGEGELAVEEGVRWGRGNRGCWPNPMVAKAHTYRCGLVTLTTVTNGERWQAAADRAVALAAVDPET